MANMLPTRPRSRLRSASVSREPSGAESMVRTGRLIIGSLLYAQLVKWAAKVFGKRDRQHIP